MATASLLSAQRHPAKTALELIEFCRRRLDASESRILADRYEKGASDRDVEDLAKGSDGKTSEAAAKRKARRAKATNANPDLADRLAKGDTSSEQVDVIADAADETTVHGPDEYIDEIEASVHTGSNDEYQADRGRDVPRSKHRRTHDQRNFDAARRLLANDSDPNGRPTTEADDVSGVASKSRSKATGSSSTGRGGGSGRSGRRATIFVKATVDRLTGTDPPVPPRISRGHG